MCKCQLIGVEARLSVVHGLHLRVPDPRALRRSGALDIRVIQRVPRARSLVQLRRAAPGYVVDEQGTSAVVPFVRLWLRLKSLYKVLPFRHGVLWLQRIDDTPAAECGLEAVRKAARAGAVTCKSKALL